MGIDTSTWVILALFAVASLAMFVAYELYKRNQQLKKGLKGQIAGAVKRSRAVSLGKAVEHLVPFMPDFPYEPGDARFLGSPVDFVVFAGLRETDEVSEIVFVEVKTGRSKLSSREQSVRRAVEEGRVSWREERPSTRPN